MTSEVVELLGELVGINSVNQSMGGPGEAQLAEFVAGYARAFGAEVTLDEALPGRPNVLVRVGASGAGAPDGQRRRLLLDVHLDTVPVDTMAEPFRPVVRDGKMWGRGACDTKASLAAALVALKQLAGSGGPRPADVMLLCSVDEEYRKRGVAHAVATGVCGGVTAAIVGEPTRLRPVVAHKGAVRWRLTAHGKAAHTSQPENGVNAIYHMVEVIDYLREHVEPELARRTHPLLTPPTLTVGRIEGGVGVNVVPASCSIDVDRRTLPTEDPAAVLGEIDDLLERLMARRPDVRLTREAPYLAERGLETDPEHPLVRLLQNACRDVLGSATPAAPVGVPYGTDATHLSPLGIPTVVFGPGDIAQAHSADEWVEVEQVEHGAAVLGLVLAAYAGGR